MSLEEKIVDKIKSLPDSEVYLLRADLTDEDSMALAKVWGTVREELNRRTFLLVIPPEAKIQSASKKWLKEYLADIIERL